MRDIDKAHASRFDFIFTLNNIVKVYEYMITDTLFILNDDQDLFRLISMLVEKRELALITIDIINDKKNNRLYNAIIIILPFQELMFELEIDEITYKHINEKFFKMQVIKN